MAETEGDKDLEVLGIVGSYRKSGNTDILVRKVLNGVQKCGVSTDYLFLPDFKVKDCIGCEKCKSTCQCVLKDDMQKIYPRLEKADALVIGSPTYFYNVTGIIKNFLDRLYCYEVFDETDRSVWMGVNEATGIKYAVTVAVCEQAKEEDLGYTSLALSRSLEAVGYRIVDNVKAFQAYAKGDILKHEDQLNRAELAGEKLAKTLLLRQKVRAAFSLKPKE